jgi:hypothetical protein
MTMMIYALFVGMVEICCFVMDAQEHFIKVRYTLQNIWWRKLTLFCDLSSMPTISSSCKNKNREGQREMIIYLFYFL